MSRYKIENEIIDDGCRAIFVFWDRECSKLFEIFVVQLYEIILEV